MSAAEYLNNRLDTELPPCRDTHVLTWMITVLGADMLLDIIDSQHGGNLSERMKRELARQRIEELGYP